MKKSINIALTCFMGGVIGTFIGLQFHSTLGLCISIIAGLSAGYLLWESPKIVKSIPHAFEAACEGTGAFTVSVLRKITKRRLRAIGLLYLSGQYLVVLFSFLMASFVLKNTHPLLHEMSVHPYPYILLLLCMGVLGMVMVMNGSTKKLSTDDVMERSLWVFKYLNPVCLPFTIAYYVIKNLYWLVVGVVKAIGFVFKFGSIFGKKLFLLIHSDIRIICAVDSAIGAGIGYYFGSPLIGGIIGAISGVVNYQVVSVRILKVQPKN
jgi:hypothetical protein